MCGRYTLRKEDIPFEEIADVRLGTRIPWEKPRFNVAPSQQMPVIIADKEGPTAVSLPWAFVPFYERKKEKPRALINARSETAREKAPFRKSASQRRCVIPADGFYEWQRRGTSKTPFFIRLKSDTLFGFAGLWDPESGYLVLTTTPNAIMESIHDRMPVILPREVVDVWLSNAPLSDEDWQRACRPYQADAMEAYPISTLVNSPRNDVPECVRPVDNEAELF